MFNVLIRSLLLVSLKKRMKEVEDEVHKVFKPKWVDDKIVTPYIKKDGDLSKRGLTDAEYERVFQTKDYKPFMSLHLLKNEFEINNIKIFTFKHNHGSIDAQTFRIGNFAYSTDFKKFYDNDIDKLKNLDLWVVGLLRTDPHPSHVGFDDLIEYGECHFQSIHFCLI